jgi:hypothetical protein
VGLPRLAAMLDDSGTAYAQGGAIPQRFVVWGFGLGVIPARWVPKATGAGDAWQLSEQLMPLSTIKDYVTVVSGTAPRTGGGHGQGNTSMLTGTARNGSRNSGTVALPTIDQLIAVQIEKETPIKSLQVGLVKASNDPGQCDNFFSFNGPNSPNPPIYNVSEVFKRLFMGRQPGPTMPSTGPDLVTIRKSVLDVVKEEAADLQPRLGAADKRRLEQHLEGIRGIERQIQGGGGCKVDPNAALPTQIMDSFGEQTTAVNRAMSQLLALAMSCDLTRVFTYQITTCGGIAKWPMWGITNHHGTSHKADPNPALNAVVIEQVKQLAILGETLRETPDGAGNVLDNTVIFTVNEMAEGWVHTTSESPTVIVGKGGGKLRGNLHWRSANKENCTIVPLTLARIVGAKLDTFGRDAGLVKDDLVPIMA